MPKPEAGSAKALSNAMKSRGLQKLKFYCEMCKKQCRDDNAFKCHSQSESHQKQMRLFAENHQYYINEYSKEFERTFLDLMRRRYFSKQVPANKIYVDMISNKQHIHMTSTKWTTLTGFIEYLGKTGKCLVEHTERGPLVQYIDRGPEAVKRKNEKEKRDREEKKKILKESKALQKFQESIQKAALLNEVSNKTEEAKEKELLADEKTNLSEEKINGNVSKIEISVKNSGKAEILKQKNPFEMARPLNTTGSLNKNLNFSAKRTDKLDQFLMDLKGKKKVHSEREEHCWVSPGLVVKIKDKGLNCFGKKGLVREVEGFRAVVEILEDRESFKIDQKLLETVIPKIGGKVKIVGENENFGKEAVVLGINTDKYSAIVGLSPESQKLEIQYEDICKISD